jgi:hypothetical protein
MPSNASMGRPSGLAAVCSMMGGAAAIRAV